MKDWRKNSTLFCCIVTSVLLGGFVCCSKAQVTITTPPENTTVCRGSDATISCGYGRATALPVTWIINGTSFTQEEIVNSPLYQLNNPTSPPTVSLTAFSINGTTTFQCIILSTPTTTSTHGTVIMTNELTPTMVAANVSFKINTIVITVSWQTITGCTANITMYNITVMDQYSSAIVTVPANVSSVQFPDNDTSIVANREYTITVSAISNQGTSYPSDPVVIDTFILQNCDVTSPSVGTIRVSCDSSHQIQVTALCADECNNFIVTSNGSSSLTVRGLDPGKRYSVTINVFDGNIVVLRNERVTKTIIVRDTILSASSLSSITSSPTTASSLTSTTIAAPSSSSKTTTTSSTISLSPTTSSSSISSSSTSSSSTISLSSTTSSLSTSSSLTISLSSTTSSSSITSLLSLTTSSASPPLPPANSDSAGGSSSGGAIAGGVIGGIVVVIVIIIIIIVICYFIFYKNKGKGSTNDDRTKLKSPPGTGVTHASERDTNVTTDSSAQYDKVVYAAPVQIVNIPHQASASGEQYAVSTKTVNKTSEQQLPQEHVEAPDTKNDFQGVTYADLHVLPSADSGNKRFSNPHPASAYAELLM